MRGWTRLLVTDLDGTFIGDDAAMHRLWDALVARGIGLAFATGRHLASIQHFYAEHGLRRRADVCICMVGTDVYFRDDAGEGYVLDRDWHARIRAGWDREAVAQLVGRLPDVVPQEAEWQSPFKLSYYLDSPYPQRLAELEARLRAAGLRAKIVFSADRFLDVLPSRAGKGAAVRRVAERCGLPPEGVITCGDTGNDLDMMRSGLGFRAIAVGNAAPELKALRAPHVYHAAAPYAAGILEGLEHYGWL